MQRYDFAYDLPPELIAQTPLAERSASRLLVLEPNADDANASGASAGSASAGDTNASGASAGNANDAEAADGKPSDANPSVGKTSALVNEAATPVGSVTAGGSHAPGRTSAIPRDCTMRDFPSLLRAGDLLVFNDTRVVAARLVGTKPSGGRVEIFLERVIGANEAVVQLRASKPIREGLEVTTAGGVVRVLGRQDDLWRVGFPGSALEFFEQWGDVPLPPYIHRATDANDRERYQSIFARERGAVAAPTASLHFDSQLIREIEARGVSRAFVTLHVGAGTFQPVRTDDLESHVMHAERVTVSTATCEAIERTRARGGRVVAIGTTVVRALESAALVARASQDAAAAAGGPTARAAPTVAGVPIAVGGPIAGAAPTAAGALSAAAGPTAGAAPSATGPGGAGAAAAPPSQTAGLLATGWSGETRLFIRPGFKFQVVDALLTNFHLPESTLLMLVCAFAGKDPVLAAYQHAVRAKYRFFSYGDAMFLTKARMGG